MEIWSRILLWCGSLLVYMGWLYKELKWRLYRYRKSFAVFIGYFLWALLNIWLLTGLPFMGSLIILTANMVYGTAFIKLVTELNLEQTLQCMTAVVGLGFLGEVVFLWLYELGEWLLSGRTELLYNVYLLFSAVLCVVMQSIILKQAEAYQKRQRDREAQLIEAMAFKENMEFQEKQYAEMAEVYDELRRLRHDMKNSLMIIEGLITQGRIEEAQKYLNEEGEALEKIPPIIQTESVVISTLLNRLFQRARKHRVQISCKIVTDFKGIKERDLCRLLGNLLDNAIEAAVQMPENERYVDLVIQGNEHRMLVETENSSDHIISGMELGTTKDDKANHGLGLKNVMDIVEAYEGNMEISGDGKRVRSILILFRKF